jgi:hypothetical protein
MTDINNTNDEGVCEETKHNKRKKGGKALMRKGYDDNNDHNNENDGLLPAYHGH